MLDVRLTVDGDMEPAGLSVSSPPGVGVTVVGGGQTLLDVAVIASTALVSAVSRGAVALGIAVPSSGGSSAAGDSYFGNYFPGGW